MWLKTVMMHWVTIIIHEHIIWVNEIVDDYSIFNIGILHNCQGSVVCVMCSRLLCPYLVCFLSSSDVIISLFLSSRVGLIVYDYPLYISPVFWVWFRLVYSLLPGVSCLSALSCPALMSRLKTIIWVYVLVCVFLFLPRVCTVTIMCL